MDDIIAVGPPTGFQGMFALHQYLSFSNLYYKNVLKTRQVIEPVKPPNCGSISSNGWSEWLMKK